MTIKVGDILHMLHSSWAMQNIRSWSPVFLLLWLSGTNLSSESGANDKKLAPWLGSLRSRSFTPYSYFLSMPGKRSRNGERGTDHDFELVRRNSFF